MPHPLPFKGAVFDLSRRAHSSPKVAPRTARAISFFAAEKMSRRLIAAFGILAFALAYLPGVAACAALPACCTGLICPMQLHHHAATHSDCGMVGMAETPSEHSSMTSCPMNDVRHSVALIFVLNAPHVTFSARPAAFHKIFSLPFAPNVILDKASPPPRAFAN